MAILAVLALVACSRNQQSAGQQGASNAAKSGETAPDPMAKAMSLYAKGYNTLLGPMKTMLDDYGEVPEQLTPSSHVHLNVSPLDDQALNDAAQAFKAAAAATPKAHAELARFADDVMSKAHTVRKTYKEASSYYGAESFKDDKGEGAKKLNDQMAAEVKAYHQALAKLDAGLKEVETAQMKAELAKYPDPNTASHQFRAFTMAARQYMDQIDNPQKIQSAMAALESAHAGLEKFADAKGAKLQPAFRAYATMADRVDQQAIVLTRNVTQKADAHAIESAQRLLVGSYNNLIQMNNSLYELESQGVLK